jgi:3-hydroxyisobutyrate dehydrogenase
MTTAQLAVQQITPTRPEPRERTAAPAIAFLGTGRMGGPMAANLARAGFTVRAWDRTVSHAAALTTDGPATEQARNGPGGFAAVA